MNFRFEELPWHDAELKRIVIDRDSDAVMIFVRWPENSDGGDTCLQFTECYGLRANMNFGVVPPDSICNASCKGESKELTNIAEKWKTMGYDLNGLNQYTIVTNSTNSEVTIYAKGFRAMSPSE